MGASITYAAAGVSIERANRAKASIRQLARGTFNRQVLSEIGSFGGLFRLSGVSDPVLVSSIDGVGTKLKVAVAAGRHRTVGYDLVCHCVNDILVQGARPLFFLDYLAMGRLDPGVVRDIVSGVAKACRENHCALIGGETAEMPGVYRGHDYDLAGCIVGVVERARILDGSAVRAGDFIYGLRSWGLHTNGYSLARTIFFERLKLTPDTPVPQLRMTVGRALLQRHKCYLDDLWPLIRRSAIHGLAHITGGGITGNVPRILPAGLSARILRNSWTPLPVFSFIQQQGDVSSEEMYRTFNMGIGMVVVVPPSHRDVVEKFWRSRNTRFYRVGEIVFSRRSAVEYG
ncbi:MAG: phosphoribosylformylglycinamidine cyclo-ligase [Acidobacteria bacterium]|nr:phosphoribosylformylglycinamidine cyclo-ligase [Acidobacteriota bacterium]